MSRDEVDRVLVGLRAACDRAGAAMVALDAHPGLAALRGPGLAGQTAKVAADLLPRTGVLWSHHAALRTGLDRAAALWGPRGRPAAAELRALTVLLCEPVVGLDEHGAALDDPSVLTPSSATVRLADLATGLERGAAEAMVLLDAVAAARTGLAGLFAGLTGGISRVRSAAVALADPSLSTVDLDRLDRAVADAVRLAFADPLGAPDHALRQRLADLEARAATVSARLAELAGLRDGFPDRVARLAATVDRLAATESELGRAFGRTIEKILNPGLPAPPDATAGLRAHLAQLQRLYLEQRFTRLAEELPAAERAAAAALTRATDLRVAADGLLDRRTELRGRLSAFQAKVGRLGLIEHSELSTLYSAARVLLYSSPCDLPAATRAVAAYQRCLNALTERE